MRLTRIRLECPMCSLTSDAIKDDDGEDSLKDSECPRCGCEMEAKEVVLGTEH